MLGIVLGLMAPAPVAAQEACVVPPALKAFATPVSPPAGTVPTLPIGRAVRVPLAVDARLPVTPGRAPAAGSRGGAFGFTVARAGRYRIAVDQPLWIEVAHGTVKYASVAHGHAPACSGARKMVEYDLRPGAHMVQLSGGAAAAAVVMVATP